MSFKTTTPILSKEETEKFIKQIDLACRLLDVQVLEWVVEKFDLHELPDSPVFLAEAPENLEFWKNAEPAMQVIQVGGFNSKCIACAYGKTVKGYVVTYSEDLINGSKVNYERPFAVNFEIVEGRLTDFGWCNAFLSPLEMKELRS